MKTKILWHKLIAWMLLILGLAILLSLKAAVWAMMAFALLVLAGLL